MKCVLVTSRSDSDILFSQLSLTMFVCDSPVWDYNSLLRFLIWNLLESYTVYLQAE